MDEKVDRARSLRRDGSKAERICWELLRAKRMRGIKFRRQHSIGPYFADFACVSRKLIVEIDGEHHAFQQERDARRTAFLEGLGWHVVRFWADEVVRNREGVWAMIEVALNERASPPLLASPPSGGEEYE